MYCAPSGTVDAGGGGAGGLALPDMYKGIASPHAELHVDCLWYCISFKTANISNSYGIISSTTHEAEKRPLAST